MVNGATQHPLLILMKSAWYWALPLLALVTMAFIDDTNSNHSLFLALNSAFYIKSEFLWLNITLFGDAAMVAVLLLPLIARRPDIVWAAIIAGILTAVMVNLGKSYFDLPRPPAVLPSATFHQFGNVFMFKSFPSGHTAGAFSVAAVVILSIRSVSIRILVLLAAVLIALSRIAIGAHWPMDVLAGAVVGWLPSIVGIFAVTHRIFHSKPAVIFPPLLLLSTVYYLIFVHQRGDAEARLVEIIVPIIFLLMAIPGFITIYKQLRQ